MEFKDLVYTRRKTLNMSMLYYFFSIKQKDNAHLFKGLKIEKDIEAKKHQNKYPTIFITLKDMKRNNFNDQTEKFAALISDIVDKNIEWSVQTGKQESFHDKTGIFT